MWQTTAVRASGIEPGGAGSAAVEARKGVLEDTGRAEDAVLRPADPGAWSHALRAALAARIARHHGEEDLARVYLGAFDHDPQSAHADPAQAGAASPLDAAVRFVDRVALEPREVEADDIAALKRAGIADADIVRLCELNAFLGYQIRLIAGLRLLSGRRP